MLIKIRGSLLLLVSQVLVDFIFFMVFSSHLLFFFIPSLLLPNSSTAAGRDSFQTHEGSTHVILNIAGHLFAFHVLTPDGQLISQVDSVIYLENFSSLTDVLLFELRNSVRKPIKKSLKDMMEKTMTSNHNAMIPLFTALDRDSWANVCFSIFLK